MPRPTDAREKAIATAEYLFRIQGYAATGLTQIIEKSGSPKGSFYFHFPGGKRELALEVIAAYRIKTTAVFRALAGMAAGNSEKFVRLLIKAVADEMSASGWTMGCVAQTLALELAPNDKEIADALSALFNEWVDLIASAIGPSKSSLTTRNRAMALVAGLEGARTLVRAQRSAAPFEAIASQFCMESAAD